MATVLEQCQISPPPETAAESSLPIVFFDIMWYGSPANQSVLFFEFPCTKTHFLDVIVPGLKRSLSLTLSHFLPLSGKIIHPLKPGKMPVLRYVAGDSVSFTVSESDAEFDHLSGNSPRACDEFYALAPRLPPVTRSPDDHTMECPVLALQVTLFPGHGVSLGFITHHAVADASTVVAFIQAWALINKWTPEGVENARARLEENHALPSYDRDSVVYMNGLESLFWNVGVEKSNTVEPPPVKVPVGRTRRTFVLKKDEINKLKNFVVAKAGGGVKHLSSFTVTCALAWICSARAAARDGEEAADDETEYFGFAADCRGRLNPPLPANYFGNCLTLVMAKLKHGELKGENGFMAAAESIGKAIREMSEKGPLDGAEDWLKKGEEVAGKRQYGVAGSPRFDFYAADYGWGRPKKFEPLFIDENGSISLCKSREFEGGLEIGLSKAEAKMEIFAAVFDEVLENLLQNE